MPDKCKTCTEEQTLEHCEQCHVEAAGKIIRIVREINGIGCCTCKHVHKSEKYKEIFCKHVDLVKRHGEVEVQELHYCDLWKPINK
jgi:hypothetical protein